MEENNKLAIPIAIVIAGLLIGGAIYLVNKGSTNTPGTNNQEKEITVAPVTTDDHILGNPDADVVIIEYSDTECPFCKDFHSVMHQVIDEYGKDGKVAWVYRHFPLASIHPKAPREAEATECAAELGGNDGFWAYIDRLFEVTPGNNGLDLSELPVIAEEVGLDRAAFESCLESGRYEDKVQASYQEALDAGGRGTPYNILLVGDQKIPFEGGQSLAGMRAVIETALKGSIPTSN
ncbi:MAG: thioredoxin domain-containing protein [Candidatus Paceibacterota bacterium]